MYDYGFEVEADAMSLVRHPWTLRKQEFLDAYAAIMTDHAIPTNIPDDPSRVRMLVAGVMTLVGAGGGALALTGSPITGGVGGVVGGGVAGGAVLLDWRDSVRSNIEKRHIRRDIDNFIQIYKREAEWRTRESQ